MRMEAHFDQYHNVYWQKKPEAKWPEEATEKEKKNGDFQSWENQNIAHR